MAAPGLEDGSSAAQRVLDLIQAGNIDIEQLFAEFGVLWTELYLDELAMVEAAKKLTSLGALDAEFLEVLSDFSHMMSPEQMRQVLLHAWVPKLADTLSSEGGDLNGHGELNEHTSQTLSKLFILLQNPLLQPVLAEVRPLVLPQIHQNELGWAVLLECDFDQTVELVCDTVCESAPALPEALWHVRYPAKVARLCLEVWASTASAKQLRTIDLEVWAEWFDEAESSKVLAAALGCKWPLDEMVERYVAVRELVADPDLGLQSALVWTLNCINTEMDGSGTDVPRTVPTRKRTLGELLEEWCAGRGIECERQNSWYLVAGNRVELRDGVFWVDGEPKALENLG